MPRLSERSNSSNLDGGGIGWWSESPFKKERIRIQVQLGGADGWLSLYKSIFRQNYMYNPTTSYKATYVRWKSEIPYVCMKT